MNLIHFCRSITMLAYKDLHMTSKQKNASKTTPPPEGHIRITINVPIPLKEKIKIAQMAYPKLPQTVAGIVLEAIENYLVPYQAGIERIQKAKEENT